MNQRRTISGCFTYPFSDYLLLAQDAVRAEHHVRQADGSWLFREFTAPDNEIELNSVASRLKLGPL